MNRGPARPRRGRRPRRAGGRDDARPPRRRDPAGRAPGRAVLAAARDRRSARARWSCSARGASRTPSAPAASTSSGAAGCRDAGDGGRGVGRPGRPPDPRAGRRGQPDRARLRAAGPPRAGAARPPALARRRARRARHRGGRRRGPADGVEAALRDARDGEPRTVRARYLVAADGAHSRVRARARDRHARPRRARPRRHGAVPRSAVGARSASTATASTRRRTRTAPARFLPAGRGDRWLYGTCSEPGRRPSATRPSGCAAASGSARGVADLDRRGSSAPAPSPSPPQLADRFRAGSASSPATPRTASRRAAAPG